MGEGEVGGGEDEGEGADFAGSEGDALESFQFTHGTGYGCHAVAHVQLCDFAGRV